MSFGSIILDYGDSLIRESEITILKTGQWLNDAVIGFYFEYLSNQSGDDNSLMFYGPGVTQLLKLIPDSDEVSCILGESPSSIQYALWPINDSSETEKPNSGSHWSLLVFSRPDNKFLHFDSHGNSNEHVARKFYQKLAPFFSATSTFHIFECCAQVNGRDCGLHVIVNAQFIQEFVSSKKSGGCSDFPRLWNNGLMTASPAQAEKRRKELLDLINSLSKQTTS